MSYIQDNLMPNEKIVFSARIHPAIFLESLVWFILTLVLLFFSLAISSNQSSGIGNLGFCSTVFLFLISIVFGLQAYIIMRTTEFAVTDHRVVAKTGFIRRHTLEMLLTKIESVAVRQTILGRLLDFGTVTVTGTGGTEESFRAIAKPINVRKKINQIIENQSHNYVQNQQNLSNTGTNKT